jgi:predicted dehydrogenase
MKKIAIVGAGARSRYMFAKPLVQDWKEHAELVGIFDINRQRAGLLAQECGVPSYDSFEAMLDTTAVDTVVVASTDSTHSAYIIGALEAGCNVITEKPMTIDAPSCSAILEAEQRTGKTVTVTFNARFAPYNAAIKSLLDKGEIGVPLHAQLESHLDRDHGAEYFRRWHRRVEQSGGLLVHKSTHHFDLLNWWLNDQPEQVSALGRQSFYGPTRMQRGERCLTCAYTEQCEFYTDIRKDSFLHAYYVEAEKEDGYIRDGCVFSDEISIHDSHSVSVLYRRGALLSYSLNAFSQYEGWHLSLQGTEGRLEAEQYASGPSADNSVRQIRVYKNDGSVITHSMKRITEGHAGGDSRLRSMLFGPAMEDPLQQQADSYAGALSLLVGVAANNSIRESRTISLQDLMKGG